MAKKLIDGLAGAIGSRFLPRKNQLVFVEYGGKLSALDLIAPLAAIVSSGSTILKGTWVFDCETGALGGGTAGAGDLWWEQQTTTARRMTPVGGARIVNLGRVAWSSVTHATLQTLTYGTTPIPGNNDASNQLVDGDVFAVRTNAGNYAKVQVLDYGYDMMIKWMTYRVASPYRVLGTGYGEPEDVAVAPDETTAYVSERAGTIVRVALAAANRASATVIASGLTAPHQLHLDADNHQLYTVEFGGAGRLLRIPTGGGAPVALASGLERADGLAITSDRQTAYVTEQAAAGHRLTRVDLATGVRTVIAGGLVEPFFLTWAVQDQRLLVTERGAARRLTAIDLATTPPAITPVATGLPDKPSSCAIVGAGRLTVCCDTEIDEVPLPAITLSSNGPLLMGIGKVPFDRIFGGLADTTGDAQYPYQFKQQPFGGTLPVLVNHQRAFEMGARHYRVTMDTAVRFDGYKGYRWNASTNSYQFRVQGAVSTVAGSGYYPVHEPSEQFLWLSPALGLELDTVGLSDGMHTLALDFIDAAGNPIAVVTPAPVVKLMINNQRCTASLSVPHIGGVAAEPVCGVLRYTRPASGDVTMPFTVGHPAGYATYSFQLLKGVNALPGLSGPVNGPPPVPAALVRSVSTLLGGCAAGAGVAGFSEYLSVHTTIINGETRQAQYDAGDAIAFALAPA